jgi:signal transduction histidine kinase
MHLVDDLLDLSRFTLGRVPLNRERMDLRIAVKNAIETLETDIHRRRHRLTVALPVTPVWLQGDGRRLEQVFVNLLANACKFTDTGGELTVRLHTSGDQAMVQFRDSGIGIDARSLPHIFDPFKQADEGARRSEAGLGIGLALVRQFVRLHGGSVRVHSAGRGRGSEFAVQLPTEG